VFVTNPLNHSAFINVFPATDYNCADDSSSHRRDLKASLVANGIRWLSD
jgi:hypothetical protein